jgi:hypothetical protein
MDPKQLDKILDIDPLWEAEKVTGKSYKDDKATSNLGFAGHIIHNRGKKALLTSLGDSHYGSKFDEYIKIIESIGFKRIYSQDFVGDSFEKPRNEVYQIYWRDDGLLLGCESYSENANSSHVYFNLKPTFKPLKEGQEYAALTDEFWNAVSHCSGGAKKLEDGSYIWSGDLDGREAVKHRISKLEKFLICPWQHKKKWLWLLNYMETKTLSQVHSESMKQVDAFNSEKLAQCPEAVRKAILHG